MKKFLIISFIILLIFAVALGLYYFLLQKNQTNTANLENQPVDYFPFENNTSGFSTTTAGQNQQPETKVLENFQKKLRLISDEPVSGMTFVESKEGDYIRYMEKATGHIYDVSTFDEKRERVSNQTIPQVQEVYFANNGNSFLARYIKESDSVENFYGNITGTSTDTKINGKIIDNTIKSISVSPSSKKIFYLDEILNKSYGFVQNPPKQDRLQVFNSKIKQFNVDFNSEDTVILTTKPNKDTLGYAYILSIKTGTIKPLLQKISGLTVKTNPDNSFVLYTNSNNSNYSLIFDNKKKETKPLSPQTFPEKCVFDNQKKNIVYCAVPRSSINGQSLDDWYLGLGQFTDDIWKYNLETSITEKTQDLDQTERIIDVSDIKINKNSSYIIFKNKIDGSLWGLNLLIE